MSDMVSTFSAIALQVLTLTGIWPPQDTQEPPPPPPPPPIETFDQFRKQTCQRQSGNGNIFGETAYIRKEPNLPAISQKTARAIAASTIAQDETLAMGLLAPFLNDPASEIPARIHHAYNMLRLNSANITAISEQVSSIIQPILAHEALTDLHYIQAILALETVDKKSAQQHLQNALRYNPKFYNAALLLSLLKTSKAFQQFASDQHCGAFLKALSHATIPVLALGPCPLQIAHFRLALKRRLSNSKSTPRQQASMMFDIILAYVANMDQLHSKLLEDYATFPANAQSCRKMMEAYGFGSVRK